jgi:hypothetical protein
VLPVVGLDESDDQDYKTDELDHPEVVRAEVAARSNYETYKDPLYRLHGSTSSLASYESSRGWLHPMPP